MPQAKKAPAKKAAAKKQASPQKPKQQAAPKAQPKQEESEVRRELSPLEQSTRRAITRHNDQQKVYDQQEQERAEARRVHNERTGDPSVA
jgi:hypothetical protein